MPRTWKKLDPITERSFVPSETFSLSFADFFQFKFLYLRIVFLIFFLWILAYQNCCWISRNNSEWLLRKKVLHQWTTTLVLKSLLRIPRNWIQINTSDCSVFFAEVLSRKFKLLSLRLLIFLLIFFNKVQKHFCSYSWIMYPYFVIREMHISYN